MSRSTTKTRSGAASTMSLSTFDIVQKATLNIKTLQIKSALRIWKGITLYLSQQILQKRIIKLDNFGIFGYNDMQHAIFLHNAVFLQTHRLRESQNGAMKTLQTFSKDCANIEKINLSAVQELHLQNCTQELISLVLSNVIAILGKLAKQGKTLQLSFGPVGDWVCQGDAVVMIISPDFQKQMKSNNLKVNEARITSDSSKQIIKNTKSRPKSSQSSQHDDNQISHSPDDVTTNRLTDINTFSKTDDQELKLPSQIVTLLREKIVERCGINGLNTLHHVIMALDITGEGILSAKEIKFGLRDLGVSLSQTELENLTLYLDKNEDGKVTVEELVNTLRGENLSRDRLEMIQNAFNYMDPNRTGVISPAAIRDNYDVRWIPAVREGRQTEKMAIDEFIQRLELDGNGKVTRDAFTAYYHNISGCITDDRAFQNLIKQMWHVNPSMSKSQPIVEVTSSGSLQNSALDSRIDFDQLQPQLPEEVSSLYRIIFPSGFGRSSNTSFEDMVRKLGVNRTWGNNEDNVMTITALTKRLQALNPAITPAELDKIADKILTLCRKNRHESFFSLEKLYEFLQKVMSKSNEKHNNCFETTLAPDTTTYSHPVLERVRNRLFQRLRNSPTHLYFYPTISNSGVDKNFQLADGLHSLQRSLKLMDKDRDQKLSKDELKIGLAKFGIPVTFAELDVLFSLFDTNHNGYIDSQEFLIGMRGPMTSRRLALVEQVFNLLDPDGDGEITLAELSAKFNTTKHPEVLSGAITHEDALRKFAAIWETDEPNGIITRKEFENYYCNVSASIDTDDYFELVMRNAWHLSGGKGQYENSTNRRVLITKLDGSQSVVEIKNDLGVKYNDLKNLTKNIENQGINNIKQDPAGIEMYGTIDTKDNKIASSLAYKNKTQGMNKAQVSEIKHKDRISRRRMQPASNIEESSPIAGPKSKKTDWKKNLQIERQVRSNAAIILQRMIRGHLSRKFTNLVRRKQAAIKTSKEEEEQDKHFVRKKILRPVY